MNGYRTEVCTSSKVEPLNKVERCTWSSSFQKAWKHSCIWTSYVGYETDLSSSTDHFLCAPFSSIKLIEGKLLFKYSLEMLPSQGKAFNKGHRFLSDYDKNPVKVAGRIRSFCTLALCGSPPGLSLRGNTSVRQHDGPGNSGSSSSIVDKQLQAENWVWHTGSLSYKRGTGTQCHLSFWSSHPRKAGDDLLSEIGVTNSTIGKIIKKIIAGGAERALARSRQKGGGGLWLQQRESSESMFS